MYNIELNIPLAEMSLLQWGLAGAIFAFVVAFVLAVFGVHGRVEVTPERQMALATGHADRRTLFENSFFAPMLWLLLALSRQLPAPNLRERLRRTLIAAGSPNFYTTDEAIAMALLVSVGSAGLLTVGNMALQQQFSPAALVIGLVGGFGFYLYHLFNMAKRRVHDIARRVPYTLDLIALAMGAGATFTEAIRTVIREDPSHPFNVELNTVLAEVELGTTRAMALHNLSDRIPLESLRSIVAAIIQAEGLGTPLSIVLKEQANLMRLQRSVRAEKLAAAASVRILVPSLLVLLSVVLTVFAPIIIRALKRELF